MQTASTDHPSPTELVEFAAGRATTQKCEAIAAHLDGCESCSGFIESVPLSADSFVAELRRGNVALTASIQEPGAFDCSTLPPSGWSQAEDTSVAAKAPLLGVPVIGSLGQYDLLAEIARGGMGVVYKARHQRLNRIVALKMILAGQLASQEEIKRFYAEAQAAAQLDHPGIVPVYEVGEQGQQYFYSMAFVDGPSLAEILRDGPLPGRDAAQVMRQVAEAVHHAHLKGVVHRDLKPANILMWTDALAGERPDDDAELATPDVRKRIRPSAKPKVTDFGLAKRVSCAARCETADELTATGQVLGTPSYMPPEQATGRTRVIGPSADIYALGAVLYALLTGRPPHQAATVLDTLLQVIDKEPVSPRQLNPDISRDLETICLRCLQKRPSDRYASAQEAAEELSRFLAGEPIQARPIGHVAHTVRWCRRHPLPTALITTVALLLVTLSVGGPLVAVQQAQLAAQQARFSRTLQGKNDQLKRAHDETESRRQSEQQARGQAMEALRSLTDDIVEQRLASQLQLTDEDRDFLRRILAHWESFASETGDSIESRSIRAEGWFRVGQVQHRLGELTQAERSYREAAGLAEKLATEFPELPEFQHERAMSESRLGMLLLSRGDLIEAEALLRSALAIWNKLSIDSPTEAEFDHEAAVVLGHLANQWTSSGRLADAEAAYQEALERHQRLVGEFPDEQRYWLELATCHASRSKLLRKTGRLIDAESALRQALDVHVKLADKNPKSPLYPRRLAGIQIEFAQLLADFGRLPEAEGTYRQALANLQQLADDFPVQPEFREDLAVNQKSLADILREHGRLGESEQTYRSSLQVFERLVHDYPARPQFRENLAIAWQSLGVLLAATGRLAEAEETWRTTLDILKELTDEFPDDPDYRSTSAAALNNIAFVMRATGRLAEAEKMYRDALRLRKGLANELPTVTEYRQELASNFSNLAVVLGETGKTAESDDLWREALDVQRQLVEDVPTLPGLRLDHARSQNNWANHLRDTGRLAEAEAAFGDALKSYQQLVEHVPDVPAYRHELAATQTNFGLMLRDGQQAAKAEKLLRGVLPLQKRLAEEFPARPEFRRELAKSGLILGVLLTESGKTKDAERFLRDSLEIQERLLAEQSDQHADQQLAAMIQHCLGNVLRIADQPRDAEPFYRSALALQRRLAAANPKDPTCQFHVAGTLSDLAQAYIERADFVQARASLDEAEHFFSPALEGYPGNPQFVSGFQLWLRRRARTCAAQGDVAACSRMAEASRQLAPDPASGTYNVACLLALGIADLSSNSQLLPDAREKAVQRLKDLAVGTLREAISQGFRDVQLIEQDTDLDALRNVGEFKRLVAEFGSVGDEPLEPIPASDSNNPH